MASIPLSDDYPVHRVPIVTYLLIAVNVVVFLLSPLAMLSVWYGSDIGERLCQQESYLLRWGAIAAELLSGEERTVPLQCPEVEVSTYPRLSALTYMFLHAGPAHLVFNMVFLFVFGPCVEDRLGRLRYLLFYLLCGVASVIGYALSEPESLAPLVGASGAISGVLGAYLVVQFRSQVVTLLFWLIPVRLPGWLMVGTYFLLQYFLYAGLPFSPSAGDPQVAYAAHVYGFLAGVLGGVLVYRVRWRSGGRISLR